MSADAEVSEDEKDDDKDDHSSVQEESDCALSTSEEDGDFDSLSAGSDQELDRIDGLNSSTKGEINFFKLLFNLNQCLGLIIIEKKITSQPEKLIQ